MGSYKERRKESKYKQILKHDFNINSSEIPSKSLMIGNAGLVSGVQYEQIAQLLTQFGSVEKIVMVPQKPYSFAVYSTSEAAEVAFNAINGKLQLDTMDGPMYLVYTQSVPTEFDGPKVDCLPEGLILLKDFVNEEEEDELLNCIKWDATSLETGKLLKHRRVKHYGYEFSYDNNNVDKDAPLIESIPEECSFITSRLNMLGHPLPWIPNQLTVNQYQKGQGIPSHIDTHSAFESPLLSLSLGSDVVMDFKHESLHVPVLLPRRSLLIMDGESRYAWTHGIKPRTMDVISVSGGLSVRERGCRTSFTLRRVMEGPCQCEFPTYCDSQTLSPSAPPTILDHQASKLESLYVHQVYNQIASHFSETRNKVWPNVLDFLKAFSPGSIIIDAGCGNGKYFGVNPNVFQVGFDRSGSLADITNSRGHEVFVSDCLAVPLRDGVADGIISIAVLHHLSTRERRLLAVNEMTRVLTPGGRALITVWAKDQTKHNMTAYLKQDRKNRRKGNQNSKPLRCEKFGESGFCNIEEYNVNSSSSIIDRDSNSKMDSEFNLPVHTARTEFEHQDVFVPWKIKSKDSSQNVNSTFLRYYHVFEEHELYQLCSCVLDIKIIQSYYTEGNYCIILEKVEL